LSRGSSERIDAHWPNYVLDLLLASALKRVANLTLDLLIDFARDQDTTWISQLLQTGSDVDALAEHIAIVLDDDVA